MTSYSDVCERWVDTAIHHEELRDIRTPRVWYAGDTIYSYGTHFPMAIAVHEGDEFAFVLVNGDRFSVSTSNHQGHVRSAIRGLPQVIIPFSALDAAGIIHNSVRVIEDTGDRHEVKQHEATSPPGGYTWQDVPVYETRDKTDAMLQREVDEHNADKRQDYENRLRWHQEEEAYFAEHGTYKYGYRAWAEPDEPTALTVEDVRNGEPTAWGGYVQAGGKQWTLTYEQVVGSERKLLRGRRYQIEWPGEIETLDDGSHLYRWETTRHWLGDSLISAEVEWTERIRCRAKGCKRGFTAEVEPQRPDENRWAFRDRTWEAMCRRCNGTGRRTVTRRRRSFYLSGFDAQEPTPSYFFCELPPGAEPTSVEEAFELLKPDPVILAEGIGREVMRQGDIFAIPIPTLTKRDLTKQGARYERRGQLLGTNHAATEVAYLPDGTTLARGRLVHVPDFRRPDHRAVRLAAKAWHVVVKNTVPVAA